MSASSSLWRTIGKRTLQIGLPLAIFLWLGWKMWNDWHNLGTFSFQLQIGFLCLAFAGFLAQVLTYGIIWRFILARLGVRLPFGVSLRVYLASEFVRYIPGNIWHILTRILWVGKYGVARSVALTSMVIELITKLAAGVFVFALSLLFWQDAGQINQLFQGSIFLFPLGIVLILALLVGLHPRVLSALLNKALRLLKREPVVLNLRYRDILVVTLAWCLSWLIAGLAFYWLLLALWSEAPLILLPLCIGIYALVWDIGFVSFITPSGLGVREWAIALLFGLAFPLPGLLAPLIAILSRVVSTIAELICVGAAYLGGLRQVKAIHDAQEALALEKEEPIVRMSSGVGIEGGQKGE